LGGVGAEWRGCWNFHGGSSRREHLHPCHRCPTSSDEDSGSQAGACTASPGELLEPTSLGFPAGLLIPELGEEGPESCSFSDFPDDGVAACWAITLDEGLCQFQPENTGSLDNNISATHSFFWSSVFLLPTASFGHPYGRIFLKIFICLFMAVPSLYCC